MRQFLIILLLILGIGTISLAQDDTVQITTFTSDQTMVDVNELRNGFVRVSVRWTVTNRPLYTALIFEQVLPDGRVLNVELPRPFQWVNTSNRGIVALAYPGDDLLTDSILLRLRLINIFTQQTIAQRELTLALVDTTQAHVSNFWSEDFPINRESLVAGTARVLVSWEAINRLPEMNLAFEQVLPDGSVVNVELPRPEPWVNSIGSGMIAPVNPGEGVTQAEFRVRLYQFDTGETLHTRTLFLPISDVIIAPTPTPRPLVVHRFVVTPTSATEGDTITVDWDVSGTDAVSIYLVYTGSNHRVAPPIYANVGSVTLVAPEGVRQATVALDNVGVVRIAEITIRLSCSMEWFTPHDDNCPSAPPQTIQATYQPFEHGYMIWRQDTELIMIYFADTDTFMLRPDFYTGDDITFSEAPPEGLVQPINGFGKIWVEEELLRERLGWALSAEQGYEMTYQETPWGVGTRISRFRMFTLPDGTVISDLIDEF